MQTTISSATNSTTLFYCSSRTNDHDIGANYLQIGDAQSSAQSDALSPATTQCVQDYTKELVSKADFSCHQRGVWRILSLSPNHVASASYDHFARIFNVNDPDQTLPNNPAILKAHKKEVLSLALQNEKTLITGSADGQLFFWDISTGDQVNVIRDNKKKTTGFYSLAVLDEDQIATGACQKPNQAKKNWPHDIKIWSLKDKKIVNILKGHEGGISALLTLENSLVSCSADKTIRIWNTSKTTCISTLLAHEDYIYSIASLDPTHIVSGSRDRKVKIWDIEKEQQTGKLEMDDEGNAHTSTVYDVATFQHHLILTGSRDGYVKIWDERNKEIVKVLDTEGQFVYSVAVLDDGRIAVGTRGQKKEEGKEGGSVIVWEFRR